MLAHTIFWQYLPAPTKAAIRAAIAEAAGRATRASPFAWLRLEAEAEERRGAVLRLSLWPDGPVDEVLALASFHGQWIEWRARGLRREIRASSSGRKIWRFAKSPAHVK